MLLFRHKLKLLGHALFVNLSCTNAIRIPTLFDYLQSAEIHENLHKATNRHLYYSPSVINYQDFERRNIIKFAYLLHISFPPTWAASLVACPWLCVLPLDVLVLCGGGNCYCCKRDNLKDVNVDVYFLVIFICCGLAYSRYYFLPSVGLLVIISCDGKFSI